MITGMPSAPINGININYKIFGKGYPLILVFGLGSDQSNWRLQTGPFSKHYRVITFDNRGVGGSDKPPGPYTINMMASDTVGLMDHLGIEKAHVVGVSMGGMITQDLAINHRDRVDKIILGCTFAGRNEESGFSTLISEATKAYEESPRGAEDIRRVINLIIDASFNKTIYRIVALPLMKSAIRFSSLRGVGEQFEAILAHDVLSSLGNIEAPTLVMTGTEDRVIKPTSSEIIANLVSKAKLVKVPGGSHGFSGEMSKEFNAMVLDFLRN